MGRSGRVVVVGAGVGGLASAIRCAVAGRPTTLLEARSQVGGKLSILQDAGFTWDTGPSLLTMPWVLDELLQATGSSLAEELDVVPLPSACRYLWQDGTVFDAHASLPALLESIRRFSPADTHAFIQFLSYAGNIWDLTADPFLYKPFDGLKSMNNGNILKRTWQLDGIRTMDQAVRSYFTHPYMQQVMNRFATYNGSSPYRTPATFNTIAWAEFALGAFYPRGGMHGITEMLERTARRVGVEIVFDAPVREISHQNGAVRGVCTTTGAYYEASDVICNVDPQIAYEHFIPGARARAERLKKRELSMSGMAILWGINRAYDHLDHHTVCFSPDYRAEFADIDAGRLHDTPTVYLNHTTHTDPAHAPAGGQNIFALVNVPAQRGEMDWESLAPMYTERVIDRLAAFGMHDLRDRMVVQHVYTPNDFARLYNAPGGAIYGLASNARMSAFLRPLQRDRQLSGLVFCGTGTHPGGGVPLAVLSGKHAAAYVLAKENKNV